MTPAHSTVNIPLDLRRIKVAAVNVSFMNKPEKESSRKPFINVILSMKRNKILSTVAVTQLRLKGREESKQI